MELVIFFTNVKQEYQHPQQKKCIEKPGTVTIPVICLVLAHRGKINTPVKAKPSPERHHNDQQIPYECRGEDVAQPSQKQITKARKKRKRYENGYLPMQKNV